MKTNLLAICSIGLMVTLPSIGGEVASKTDATRTTQERRKAAKVAASQQKREARLAAVDASKPCDSAACRPIRFAWSPVAPGS